MVDQRAGQADRCPGRSHGHLGERGVYCLPVRPAVHTPAEYLDDARVAQPVQGSVVQPGPACLGVGERLGEPDQNLGG